jgi:hypothetical protein
MTSSIKITTSKEYWATLSDEEFDKEIQRIPHYRRDTFYGDALSFPFVVERMLDSQFIYCVQNATIDILKYEHTRDRLSHTQFDYCVKKCPKAALYFCETSLSLTQLDNCVKATFINYEEDPTWSPVQKKLEQIKRHKLQNILNNIQHKLTPYQRSWIRIKKEEGIWLP